MKAELLVCILICVKGQVFATVWEFGEDAPGSQVVSHLTGQVSILEKVKDIYLTVPPCYQITYIRVEVDNLLSTPAVSFNKLVNVVTISYKLLQFSPSWYDVIVKAKRGFGCYQDADISQVLLPVAFRRYMSPRLALPNARKFGKIGC